MGMSTCEKCGAEYHLETAPRFCRRCDTLLLPAQPGTDPLPAEDREAAFRELVALIDSALPKNFYELTHKQLKDHLVQAIWEWASKTASPHPYPDMLLVQEFEQWVRRDFGPKLMPIRQVTLLREYHFRKDAGEVHHLSLTPREAEKLQLKTAPHGCEITPCECEDTELH